MGLVKDLHGDHPENRTCQYLDEFMDDVAPTATISAIKQQAVPTGIGTTLKVVDGVVVNQQNLLGRVIRPPADRCKEERTGLGKFETRQPKQVLAAVGWLKYSADALQSVVEVAPATSPNSKLFT